MIDGGSVVVEVRNTGARPGDEVVQLYVDLALGSDARALRTLRGFERVSLEPHESKRIRVPLAPDWRIIHVGTSADPRTLRTVEITPCQAGDATGKPRSAAPSAIRLS